MRFYLKNKHATNKQTKNNPKIITKVRKKGKGGGNERKAIGCPERSLSSLGRGVLIGNQDK